MVIPGLRVWADTMENRIVGEMENDMQMVAVLVPAEYSCVHILGV